jgi:formylglycine-generating enzyme required for sulfatase activity
VTLLAAAWLVALSVSLLHAAPASDVVRLKSGSVLQGRIVGQERVQGQTLLKIETDFGNLLVPESQTTYSSADPPAPTPIFHARAIRVVRIEGVVERRPPGAVEWSRLAFTDGYGVRLRPDELVFPGDSLRTAEAAAVDLMLHRDVWVRIAGSSEVEITPEGERPTLQMLRGVVSQHVRGRPRGGEHRVGTPTTVLGVRGTVFTVRVHPEGESVTTTEGIVSVGSVAEVPAGSTGRWTGTGPVTITPATPGERADAPVPFARLPLDDLVLVPAGRYRQGGQQAHESEGTSSDYTYRQKHVRQIAEFWIGRTEVSCADYELFVHATGAARPAYWPAGPLEPDAASRPVVGISKEAARSFALWTGSDLPREAQWEAAARGPRGNFNPWGRESAARLRVHRPEQAADLQSIEGPTDDVSPFGCLQMASNAAELCGDMDNYMVAGEMVWRYGSWDDLAVRGGFSTHSRISSQLSHRPVGLRLARVDPRSRR